MSIQYPFDLAQSDQVRRAHNERQSRSLPLDTTRTRDRKRYAPPPTGRDDMSWPDPWWMYGLAGAVVVLACVWVL